jgi:site-specific DNA recombinase
MMIDKRVSDGMIRRASEGKIISRMPFGYVVRNGEVEIIEEEAEVVRLIYDLYYDKGMGYGDISSYLNSRNLSKRGIDWRRDSVKRTLENKTYHGLITIKDKQFPGDFRAIIIREYNEPGESVRRKVRGLA